MSKEDKIRFQNDLDILLITLKPFERVFTLKINQQDKIYSFDFPEFQEDIFYNFSVMMDSKTVVSLIPIN